MTFFQWIPEGALCFQPGARAFAPLRVRRPRAAGPGLLRGLRGATALEGAGKGRMKVGDLGLVHSVDLFVYPLVNIYKKLWKGPPCYQWVNPLFQWSIFITRGYIPFISHRNRWFTYQKWQFSIAMSQSLPEAKFRNFSAYLRTSALSSAKGPMPGPSKAPAGSQPSSILLEKGSLAANNHSSLELVNS